MVFPDALGGFDREANLVVNRAVVPRLADAETIHITDPHIGHHLRWGHHDIFNILERINAISG